MSEARPELKRVQGRGRRIGIVVGRYNGDVTSRLLAGARECLGECGVAAGDLRVVEVSGAFELPIVAQRLLEKPGIHGVIALAAVIRGDTPHFDYVCQAAADGCLRVMLDARKPVAFGVLTCDTQAQADARAVAGEGNKGREAALALLDALTALDQI